MEVLLIMIGVPLFFVLLNILSAISRKDEQTPFQAVGNSIKYGITGNRDAEEQAMRAAARAQGDLARKRGASEEEARRAEDRHYQFLKKW